jgi:hypothetical protein
MNEVNNLFFQPGVYYVRKDGELTVGDYVYMQNKYDLRYIQVPIALKYKNCRC